MSGKPYQSKLVPYRKDILRAWYRRQTLPEIQAMSANRSIIISLPGISLFIKRCRKCPVPHDLSEFSNVGAKPQSMTSKAMKKLTRLMKRDPDEIKKEWIEKQYTQKNNVYQNPYRCRSILPCTDPRIS